MKLSASTALLVALVLSGCGSVEMAPQMESAKAKSFGAPQNGNAGVYIYRNSSFGGALKRDIWIDGECLGQSGPFVFFYTQVPGGKNYEIATESEFSPNILNTNLEANKNYFFRQYIKLGVFVGGANIEAVSENQGKQDIASLEMAKGGKCSGTIKRDVASSVSTTSPVDRGTSIKTTPIETSNSSPIQSNQAEQANSQAPAPTSTTINQPVSQNLTKEPETVSSSTATNLATPIAPAANNTKVEEKTTIQLVDFELGTSSITVEKLAKERACYGGKGAGRVSPKGVRELYKMQCADGRVLMAKCELRQCTILSLK